ncbi:HelD family protein [Geosporobacter ferrireducens]|nr:UvrD-helicase domain-containing protein [Geosporobacter ferrireducens]
MPAMDEPVSSFRHYKAFSVDNEGVWEGANKCMERYEENLEREKEYLKKTLAFIRGELDREAEKLTDKKNELLALRKEMYENTVHFSTDFTRMTEINQYLSLHQGQTTSYDSTFKQIIKYKKMLSAPYFGRFDFTEEELEEEEKIYIGLHNVVDAETYDILVYDWRAPISSIFYQSELGPASYRSPQGIIKGKVSLKRQYKIHQGELQYYFDSSLKIDDEMLQQVLSQNASPRMRNIVETIQKEQNQVIRDLDNELLLVQGVAGSGKTSIALHRIAYLLYHGMIENLYSNNILILSPNEIFSQYISGVLPELGEENVQQITFDALVKKLLGDQLKVEKRQLWLETLMACNPSKKLERRKTASVFKGSRFFAQILERLILTYERKYIPFEDVYYDGQVIATKQLLKNQFLQNKIGRPMAKRLKRIENILLDRIHEQRKLRIGKIEKLVQQMDGHELEIKAFSRLLSMKESSVRLKKIRKMTEVSAFEVYRLLFTENGLFEKLAKEIDLPGEIKEIIEETKENLDRGYLAYEDCAPLLFLKLKLEGSDEFREIKQVVIDEAQDYTPMQYEVFHLLFRDSRWTVLGDIYQSIDREGDLSLYQTIVEIMAKQKAVQLFLNKSYRSSHEISSFAQKLLRCPQEHIHFERKGTRPAIIYEERRLELIAAMISRIKELQEEKWGTIALLCKTAAESENLYHQLKDVLDLKLILGNEEAVETGTMILPVYLAKGLEFDAVVVYNVSADNYNNAADRRLLYVACTRALHRLILCYTGSRSPILPD